jgi:gluconate 2-dehydrogenase gamma chain
MSRSHDTEPQPTDNRHTRREVMALASVALGGAVTGVGGAMLVGQVDRSSPGGWHFFTPDEALMVEAISEQIIPADQDPGAKQAGVVYFIDRQLVGPYQRFQAKYRNGLRCLTATCQQQFQKNFEALAWDDQTKLLRSLEASRVPKELWKDPSAVEFFGLLRDHSMQGFYGSPRHGGNRGYASYKMLGLEYPRVIGQNRYPVART